MIELGLKLLRAARRHALLSSLLLVGSVASLMLVETQELMAQERQLQMLDGLAKGGWAIRPRGGKADRKICVRSGREFIQLRHMGASCDRIIVTDTPSEVTVQYKCGREGYGRTTIRRETRELVQLDSQGIAGEQPFQFAAEARRTGDC